MVGRINLTALGVAAGVLAAAPLLSKPAPAAPAPLAAAPPAFAKCAMCHATTRGANGIGPSLVGIVGAKSATRPGFAYSTALRKANVVWTRAALDRFLANPASVAPGTTMPNPGVTRPADRAAIIAYLTTLK